jgi:sortase (surface protein transpeptidase)
MIVFMFILYLEQAIQFLYHLTSTNLANFILLAGVIISAVTFFKTFGKMKSSEQLKMAHDIQVMLSNAYINYDKILHSKSDYPEDKERNTDMQKRAYMEILNVLE